MFKRLIISCCVLVLLSANFVTVYAEKNASEMERIEREHREELRTMWDSHDVEISVKSIRLVDPGYTGIGSKGDILIALDSITDHVAIVKDAYIVIEAHPDNPNGGVDYRANDWISRYSEIKGLRVSGTSSSEKSEAVSYAENQIGEPYSLATTHWTTDKWYCSKLVWRAWYNQGFDIEGRTYEPRGSHVTPGDILDSPLTSVFYSSF
ncbi:MAG: hypothetical protein COA82_11230 [Alkaliphilus sp.]|nr:hypothetical protein [bacterium AH-315-L21]MBN4069435.1 hypothetical protein [bacterium AH-315-G05]MBN4074495.1 hypothetical protein [bacterium AH-315-E09]PHS30627.1 MAG: hypothetical protein COA82_11230 [Alkaliphilus sp.]